MRIEAFLDTALQTGVSIALLLGLVMLIRPLFAKHLGARATYALWLLPFIRLFLPPVTLTGDSPAAQVLPVVTPLNYINLDYLNLWPFIDQPQNAPHKSEPAASGLSDFFTQNGTEIIIALWLGVAFIWIGKVILGHRRTVRALRLNSDPAPDALKADIEAARKAVGLRRSPEVRIAHVELGPLVTCPWSPMLVLPEKFMQTEDFAQSGSAAHAGLIHELAHIKRRDLWAAFAAVLFRAINWPNPLVHLAAKRFRLDLEAACDEYVLHKLRGASVKPLDYAHALLGLQSVKAKDL